MSSRYRIREPHKFPPFHSWHPHKWASGSETVMWTECSPNYPDHLQHEFGFKIKLRPMQLGCWIREQRKTRLTPRHSYPTSKFLSLQCICLDTVHHSFGPTKLAHFRLDTHFHAPFVLCNVYTYNICFKDTEYPDCLILNYELTVFVKYGFHPLSLYLRDRSCKKALIPDDRIIKLELLEIQRGIWEFMHDLIKGIRRRQRPSCSCWTCTAKLAIFQFIAGYDRPTYPVL